MFMVVLRGLKVWLLFIDFFDACTRSVFFIDCLSSRAYIWESVQGMGGK